MADLLDLFVKISVKDEASTSIDGISNNITKKLGSSMATFGKVAAAGVAAATAAVAMVSKASLSAYADYEQLVGGVETLFGGAAGTLQQYASEAFRTCGLSANQYMEQATSFAASLVSSCGGDTAQAAEYANMAMVDMADNVNKMGSSMESVQNAYQGFAKQNYTMLDNLKLGYGGTKEEMERLIDDANKLREAQGENADLTIESYADVVEAIHTVQYEMGIAGTTSLEAATTISGSISTAKAAWENFLTGLAREDADFSQLTEQLLSSIGNVAKNVLPRVALIGDGIINAFPVVLAGLGSTLATALSEALADAWNVASTTFDGLGIELPSIDATGVSSDVSQALESIGQMFSEIGANIQQTIVAILPTIVQLIQVVIATLAAVAPVVSEIITQASNLITMVVPPLTQIINAILPVISQLLSAISPVITQIVSNLGAELSAALTVIIGLVNYLVPVLENIIAAVLPVAVTVIQSFVPVFAAVETALQGIITFLTGVFTGNWGMAWEGIKQVASGIWDGIKAVIETAINTVLAVIDSVLGIINGIWIPAWESILSFASNIWSIITGVVNNAITGIQSVIDSVLSTISSVWNSVWSSISGFFSGIWDGLKNAASNGISAVFDTVCGIKDSICDFFANAGTWLLGSGRAILQGLIDGITGAIGGAIDAVSGAVGQIRNLFPFSPAKEGPFSGHGYTTYSGKALITDFGKSVEEYAPRAQSAIANALGDIQDLTAQEMTFAAKADVSGTYRTSLNESNSKNSNAREVTNWLAQNLPAIIAAYTPTISERDFARKTRKAVAYG